FRSGNSASCSSLSRRFCDPSLALSSSSSIAFLKPLTAPPRSPAADLRRLVPKISTTIKSTISQCQMLPNPIACSVRLPCVSRNDTPIDFRRRVALHLQPKCDGPVIRQRDLHVGPETAASMRHSRRSHRGYERVEQACAGLGRRGAREARPEPTA